MMAVLAWWLLNSSAGRIGIAIAVISFGVYVAIERAENRGAADQVAKQERVDNAAKQRADRARKQARAQSKQAAKAKKPEPKDGFQRD